MAVYSVKLHDLIVDVGRPVAAGESCDILTMSDGQRSSAFDADYGTRSRALASAVPLLRRPYPRRPPRRPPPVAEAHEHAAASEGEQTAVQQSGQAEYPTVRRRRRRRPARGVARVLGAQAPDATYPEEAQQDPEVDVEPSSTLGGEPQADGHGEAPQEGSAARPKRRRRRRRRRKQPQEPVPERETYEQGWQTAGDDDEERLLPPELLTEPPAPTQPPISQAARRRRRRNRARWKGASGTAVAAPGEMLGEGEPGEALGADDGGT
jgi:hypothetical protein